MSDDRLSRHEQDELVSDIVGRFGGLDDDELDDAFDKLDAEHTAELNQELRDYADNAVGSDTWDSDE